MNSLQATATIDDQPGTSPGAVKVRMTVNHREKLRVMNHLVLALARLHGVVMVGSSSDWTRNGDVFEITESQVGWELMETNPTPHIVLARPPQRGCLVALCRDLNCVSDLLSNTRIFNAIEVGSQEWSCGDIYTLGINPEQPVGNLFTGLDPDTRGFHKEGPRNWRGVFKSSRWVRRRKSIFGAEMEDSFVRWPVPHPALHTLFNMGRFEHDYLPEWQMPIITGPVQMKTGDIIAGRVPDGRTCLWMALEDDGRVAGIAIGPVDSGMGRMAMEMLPRVPAQFTGG